MEKKKGDEIPTQLGNLNTLFFYLRMETENLQNVVDITFTAENILTS
jgi:hypothetical protein